jgi:hypothetical protein
MIRPPLFGFWYILTKPKYPVAFFKNQGIAYVFWSVKIAFVGNKPKTIKGDEETSLNTAKGVVCDVL